VSPQWPRSEIRELLKLLERPDNRFVCRRHPDPALFPMDAIRAAYADILADPPIWRSGAAVFGQRRLRARCGGDRGYMGAAACRASSTTS